MNENVLSFIKWAAGIAITLAIISIAFVVFNMAKDGTNQGIAKMGEMNFEIADSDLTIYDDQEISGSAVVNAIKNFDGDYLGVRVQTGKNPGGTWYGYSASISVNGEATMGSATSSDVANAIDETSSLYVNPNGQFLGKIYRDSNGTITALSFIQK